MGSWQSAGGAEERRREGLERLPRAYNRLFKAGRRAHSRAEVTPVSERAFDGDQRLDPWSENAGS